MASDPIKDLLEIDVSRDRMQAVIRPVRRPTCLPGVAVEDVKGFLDENKVSFGIGEGRLAEVVAALRSPGGLRKVIVVAQGKPPIAGQDSRLGLPDIGEEFPQSRQGDSLLWCVEELHDVCTVLEPTAGSPGKDVLGCEVECRHGAKLDIGLGNKTNETIAGKRVATTTGLAHYHHGEVQVLNPVQINEDKMSAVLVLRPVPDDDAHMTLEMVTWLVKKLSITKGVNSAHVKQALEAHRENAAEAKKVILARGKPPTVGEDGKLDFNMNVQDSVGAVRDDGSIDYRERGLITNVKEGDLLTKVLPPKKGKPGRDIFGQEVPGLMGRPAVFQASENTKLSPDEKEIFATVDGMVRVLEDGQIQVIQEYVVSGDVDYSTGHVESTGDVLVEGSILSDFKVTATGNIDVRRNIDKGSVETDGALKVGGGIIGKSGMMIKVGTDIEALYAENATIRAGGDVEFSGGLVYSEVRAKGSVRLTGRRGNISGGRVVATHGVEATDLGADTGVRTEIIVGVDPDQREELIELRTKLPKIEKRIKHIDLNLGPFLTKKGRMDKLRPQRLAEIKEMVAERKQLHEKREACQIRIEELRQEMAESVEAQVVARGTVYPGVVISIGELKRMVIEPTKDVVFYLDKEKRAVETSCASQRPSQSQSSKSKATA